MTKTVEWKTHQSSCIVMPKRQTTQIYIYGTIEHFCSIYTKIEFVCICASGDAAIWTECYTLIKVIKTCSLISKISN